jgi:ribonuclease P protein component
MDYLFYVTEGLGKFSGKERVRKREDIARLMRKGDRHYSKQYSLVVVKNSLDVVRIAVSVKKKVGKAAERNYEKRLVRECFRREKDHFPKGFDLLVIVKQTTDDFDLSYRSLKSLFCRSLL